MALKDVVIKNSTRLESERFEFESKGDVLEGYLLEAATLTSKDTGKQFKKYTIRTSSGNRSTLGSHKLDEGLEGTKIGEYVVITYNGTQKLPGGKHMKLFRVQHDDEDVLPGHGSSTSTAEAIIRSAKVSA